MYKYAVTLFKGLVVFAMAIFIVPYEMMKRSSQSKEG
jgi:hypothetical protein